MAMGSRSRREAENAIGSCRPFSNSTGSFYGTRGAASRLGWLENHTEARRMRELLRRAVYVVWSYGTPIAWVSETEDGERTAYYVDESHSVTTSHHQGVARVGLGEYETIGERRPVRRPGRERRPVRTTEGYGHAPRRDVPADSPGYQLGRTEDEQQSTLQRLLDPRYSDPNWVPDRDPEADRQAELRDIRRVEREGAWRL